MFNPGVPEPQFFNLLVPHVPLTPALRACPTCGLTYKHLQGSSVVGCSNCYDHFREPLSLLIRRIHGSANHSGKVPTQAVEQIREQIRSIREKMKEAVSEERFEEAAILRDQIHALRRDIGDSTA